jgi:hypothetical protein
LLPKTAYAKRRADIPFERHIKDALQAQTVWFPGPIGFTAGFLREEPD